MMVYKNISSDTVVIGALDIGQIHYYISPLNN